MCGTVRRIMKSKATLKEQLKLYIIMAAPTAMYGNERNS
jgi:hypothetical protein